MSAALGASAGPSAIEPRRAGEAITTLRLKRTNCTPDATAAATSQCVDTEKKESEVSCGKRGESRQ